MAEFEETFGAGAQTIRASTEEMQRSLDELDSVGRRFSLTLSRAFVDLAAKGKGLNDVLRSLALSLSQIVLRAALSPLTDQLGRFFSGAVRSGFGFAKGGALQQGLPVPFAAGGVIASPVTFPLAGGRLGVAGERGAEAILPLTRGPDGRLGVMAQGGGGVSVTFNVTTPDADSFQRSQSQVAAMVARAVALGQRNL